MRMRVARAFACLIVVVFVLLGPSAHAAPPVPEPPPNCSAVEAQLSRAESLVQSCESARHSVEADEARCAANLEDEESARIKAEGETKSCTGERDELCRQADGFVREILRGHVTNVGSCVLSGEQRQLLALLRSWENVTAELLHLDAYASGESDVLLPGSGDSPAERLLERLLGPKNQPLFYRRLITEAVKIVAPHAWTKLKEPFALESWFLGTEPLSPAIVDEAQRERGAGSSLTDAVRLVHSYLFLAHCTELPTSRTCVRAKQLAQLLDSTGPLLLRRRIEAVWATECSDVGPTSVLSWIQDFPTTQLSTSVADFSDVDDAVTGKLWSCYLRDVQGEASFSAWRASRLPKPQALDDRTLRRVDALRSALPDDSREAVCGRAVRALEGWPASSSCTAPPPDVLASVERWAKEPPAPDAKSLPILLCERYARLIWEGKSLALPGAFPHSPSIDEMISLDPSLPESAIARVRAACDARRGVGDAFARGVSVLASISKQLGEEPGGRPWRVDGNGAPVEAPRLAHAESYRTWALHVVDRATPCSELGLLPDRCQECAAAKSGTFYDCDALADLDAKWRHWRQVTYLAGLLVVVLAVCLRWGVRLVRAIRRFGPWARETRARFAALDLPASPDPLRVLFPDRYGTLVVALPRAPAWERWGARAAVQKVLGRAAIREADVNQAVQVAARVGARVVFLLHDDSASLEFGGARAILDWAARGGAKTMHVLPLAVSRLSWARSGEDLLDLVEESSLRGNPFEVRGRITSSSQFWNRERLVSGLLAEARAGHWLVVTGLRRFGKSSLSMEVARRLTGPSAYVDLAGFHHEIGFLEDPSQAVDAVLRAVCARLAETATALYSKAPIPEPPMTSLDAAAFSAWTRKLTAACTDAAGGRPPPLLIVLDEIEQVLAVGPARLGHVLDVLSILFGRLKNAIGEVPHEGAASPIGVLLASALHPLLWAPLRTLGQQSIMGAFPSICVPCLPDEAASAMMRGLGARQGIRFSEEALSLIIRQSQGVPLLLRRIGTSILELYDSDRARQGALGAVQVGIEAAREALAREEKKGSPLRVWVESEIADASGVGGALLRRLASNGKVPTRLLRTMAEEMAREQFASSGIGAHLQSAELGRRAEEAASVIVRLLGESGLLVSHGDLTDPEAYELPDGAIRRILGEPPAPSIRPAPLTGSPIARPER